MPKRATITCGTCNGTGGAVRVCDYVRGDRTEYCITCDGDGVRWVDNHPDPADWLDGLSEWGSQEIAAHTSKQKGKDT